MSAGLCFAFALAGGAAVADDQAELVAAMRAVADNPSLPIPAAAAALGFRESYQFADAMNASTIRRLLLLHRDGRIILPTQLLDALRFKSPGILNRRRGRD